MIPSMELKADISKDALSPLMSVLSSLKTPANAYDLTINTYTLFGVTTGYRVSLKTKIPEVMIAAIGSISQ